MALEHQPLAVTPAAVRFPATFLRAQRVQSLEVANPNQVAVHARLEVTPPFSVTATVDLAAGETRAVPVTFVPLSAGPAAGLLSIDDGVAPRVQFSIAGEGLAWPDCGDAGACAGVAFDPEQGTCTTTQAPDDTPCTASFACFARAVCAGGQCVGLLSSCDDGDPCTIDGCGERGCLHVPRTCAVTDRCLVAQCDPRVGCTSVPLEDGTPCGPDTCAAASICVGGRCEVRAHANADVDCHYLEVASGLCGRTSAACALTLGGAVKCWGGSRQLPWTEPGWQGASSLLMGSNRRLCAVLRDGRVGCSDRGGYHGFGPPFVRAFSERAVKLAPGTWEAGVCALLESGQVECDLPDGGVEQRVAPEPSRDLSSQAAQCALGLDGGLRCTTPTSGLGPLARLASVVHGSFGLDALGAPVTITSAVPGRALDAFDAGLTFLGGGRLGLSSPGADTLCGAFVDGRVRCVEWPPGDQRPSAFWEDSVPAPVKQLSSGGYNEGDQGALCALDGHGEVRCLGGNRTGALGDLSANPTGVVEAPLGGPSSLLRVGTQCCADQRLTTSATWAAVNGTLLMFSTEAALAFDGGYPVVFPHPAPSPRALSVVNGTQPVPLSLRVLDAEGGVWTFDRRIDAPEPMVKLAGEFALGASGTTYSLSPSVARVSDHDVVDLSIGCVLKGDGGVWCDAAVPVDAARVLSVDSTQWQGCAGLQRGGVECWAAMPDGGMVVELRADLFAFPRQLTGWGVAGCALTGANGVECWGTLGLPDGGPRPIAIDEPVSQLSWLPSVACALTTSGRLLCWGDNQQGLLASRPLLESWRFLKVPW